MPGSIPIQFAISAGANSGTIQIAILIHAGIGFGIIVGFISGAFSFLWDQLDAGLGSVGDQFPEAVGYNLYINFTLFR